MTENEALLVQNLLNGVEPARAAQAAGLTEEEGLAAFSEAMKRVAEYRMVHCMPFFECGTPGQARAARIMVLDAMERIQRWDDEGRELMIAVFKGQKPDRAEAEVKAILAGTLNALPYYLDWHEHRNYYRDRQAFIRAHRSRVIGLLERFISFRAPLLLKNVKHVGVSPDNAAQVALYAAGH
jgi:hypothetical protein